MLVRLKFGLRGMRNPKGEALRMRLIVADIKDEARKLLTSWMQTHHS